VVEMTQANQSFTIECPAQPLRVDVDPLFDVFRRLDRNEIPPAFSQVFGAEKVTIVLPSKAAAALAHGYASLAQDWGKSDQITIVRDTEIKKLPTDQGIWLFGRTNLFADAIQAQLTAYEVNLTEDRLSVGQTGMPLADHCFVLTARNPQNPDFSIAWLAMTNPKAADGLSRKLPHYGKYSYLGFQGDEPVNILKGQWPTINSPLTQMVSSPKKAGSMVAQAKLPTRTALAELAPVFSEQALLQHIKVLADDKMKGRGFGSPELEQAANYISHLFEAAGLEPGADDGSYFQTWEANGGEPSQPATLKNVIGYIPGTNGEWSDQSVVVSAHYDHLGLGWPDSRSGEKGKIHNGADDNASGVAVLIELAKLLASDGQPQRNIVFVAFTAEEAGRVGSKYYVEHYQRFPAKKAIGVLNLDTVGRLNNQKIFILGGSSAREWVHIFRGIGFVTGIEHQMVDQELDASDQVSFIEKGVPGVQIFTGPNFDYHRPSDDVEKIDAAGLVKVATVTREAVNYLAERAEPLTPPNVSQPASGHPGQSGTRRVSLGTMPDFGFSGDGVRVAAVTPDSPASQAGIQKDDVLKQIGDMAVHQLRDLSEALKQHQPGDKVKVVFERGGETIEKEVVLSGR